MSVIEQMLNDADIAHHCGDDVLHAASAELAQLREDARLGLKVKKYENRIREFASTQKPTSGATICFVASIRSGIRTIISGDDPDSPVTIEAAIDELAEAEGWEG